jgi:hypothetical protein
MNDRDLQRLIELAAPHLIGARAQDARESAAAGQTVPADRLRTALAAAISPVDTAPDGAALTAADRAISDATAAVRAVQEAKTAVRISDEQRSSLEAIVYVTGRPAMWYFDGRVQPPSGDAAANQHWITMLGLERDDINKRSQSVGRVGLVAARGVVPLGTGWRVAKDLVVTNRHVAARLMANAGDPVSAWTIGAEVQAIVEFGCTDRSADRQDTRVTEFVYCRESQNLDLALLRIATDRAVPEPLPLEWRIDMLGKASDGHFMGRDVYVVGHPYDDTSTGPAARVFVRADGLKRCSPGKVRSLAGSGPEFEHDCSTLSGNSGSCVFTADTHKVVGLHVGGRPADFQTGLASANVALALGRLSKGDFADLTKI